MRTGTVATEAGASPDKVEGALRRVLNRQPNQNPAQSMSVL
jgi:hypothetical protein